MRKRYVLAFAVLVFTALVICICISGKFGVQNPDTDRMIYYFYESVCGSCNMEEDFYAELSEQMGGRDLPDGWNIRCVNVFRDGDTLYQRMCEEQGISREKMGLPMLMTPAGAAVGKEEISGRMRELIHASCGVPETVWYYQRPDCKDCQEVSDMIQKAALSNPQYFFVEVDTNYEEAKETFKSLLISLGIPQESWEVPFLYKNGQWLSGSESIREGLESFFQ